VVAAVSQAAEGVIVNAPTLNYSIQGLYYSTDSGQTWYMATIKDGSQTVQTEGGNFSSYFGNPATSVVWNPIRQRFYAAIRYHGYYESSDGINWTRLANQPGTNLTTTNCPVNPNAAGAITCPIFRGQLSVDTTTGDIFALSVDGENHDQGLWQDVCNLTSGHCASGTELFATHLNSTPLEVGGGNTTITQADYDLYLAAVHTGNDTLLFAGTEDIFRCSIGAGCALRNATNAYSCAAAAVAPAQHAMDFIAGDGPLLYFGNDGGLWRSTDGVNQQQAVCSGDDATHFQNLNSGLGSLAEVESLTAHPSDATQMLAGLGANGTAASDGSATATGVWLQLSSGEGGVTAIDSSNPLNWFISTDDGVNINLCSRGESCTAANYAVSPQIGASQVSDDEALMDAPYILDPALTSQLIAGTCRVWRGPAIGGSSWNGSDVLSPMLDGVSNSFCNGNALVRSLAAGGPLVANEGSQVIYAGMAGELDGGGIKSGHIFSTALASTANAGTAWSDLYARTVSNDPTNSGQLNPGNFDISAIAVDTSDATGMTVYATVMGFSGNAYGVPHIYMSTTGGAAWTNISNNLPNSPANAVLVDPNDHNTVYVAMDSGVYVTQAVSTCSVPTVDCWNVFGIGLPNAPVTQLAAIAANGSSVLAAGTYGRGVWQLPLASTLPPTTVTFLPASLNFASQTTGTSSSAQSITATNTGSTSLLIRSVTADVGFSETDNCSDVIIAAGGNCTVNVTFSPTTAGVLNGTVTLTANVTGGTATASLSGTGIAAPAPVITFSPTSLTFAALDSGGTSAAQSMMVTNSGNAVLKISQVSLLGDFSETDNCTGATIAIGSNCSMNVSFTPLAAGLLGGVITVSANVGSGASTANLTGTGIAIGMLTPTPQSMNFGMVYNGNSSAPLTLTVQNTGSGSAQISSVASSANFSETDNCTGVSLAVNAVCIVQLIFTPTVYGTIDGTVTVASNAFNSPLVVNLGGFGLGAANVTVVPSPTSLTFPTQPMQSTSAMQYITISVTSASALNPPAVTVTGDFRNRTHAICRLT
jgi:hypothetical protein